LQTISCKQIKHHQTTNILQTNQTPSNNKYPANKSNTIKQQISCKQTKHPQNNKYLANKPNTIKQQISCKQTKHHQTTNILQKHILQTNQTPSNNKYPTDKYLSRGVAAHKGCRDVSTLNICLSGGAAAART
jgi:hypothetical protein